MRCLKTSRVKYCSGSVVSDRTVELHNIMLVCCVYSVIAMMKYCITLYAGSTIHVPFWPEFVDL